MIVFVLTHALGDGLDRACGEEGEEGGHEHGVGAGEAAADGRAHRGEEEV